MPDTLTRLTTALHEELCRLHDVAPEGHSMCGDFAALRDDAAKLAEVAFNSLHPTVTDGRLIADLYEEAIRFWFGECFPNVSTPALLIDGIRGQLGGFVTEELIGREQKIEALEAEVDRLRDLLTRVTRMDYDGVDVYPHGDSWMTAWRGSVEDHASPDDAIARAKEIAGG
ncbi:hypothetical protein [Nocardiopsis sp. CA-288880]|uniref:hypothetical protein n=1 Tax=Nocardiopsis sp. CA-288880 TaxID=3239995 RepID=UPI003D989237